MTQVFNEPITRQFTNTGGIAVGWQKFFYDTGTSTKKSIFADKDLVTPLTNPVISDANGYFPQIFMESTGDAYKVVIATDTDTDPPTSPINTADPVEVDANNINAFGTRPAQHWGTTTNTAAAYQITPVTAIASYTSDLLFSLQIHTNSTGAGTLAVADLNNPGSFLSALNIKKYNGAGGKVNIEVDDLLGNQTYIFRIDSVDAVVLNPEKANITAVVSTPPGTVSSFFFETPPTGWLECDGSAQSRTTFAALFAAVGTVAGIGDGSTTFNLPDLRGEFIRGWEHNGVANDPDAAGRTDSGNGTTGDNVGTKQADALQGHNHNLSTNNSSGSAGSGAAFTTQAEDAVRTDLVKTPVTDGVNGTPRTTSETRPTNVYMMYCIKT